MSSTTQPYVPVEGPPSDLRIVHWPLSDEPITAGAAVLAIGGVGWVAWHVTASAAIGLVAGALLAAALWRIFLPTTYELTGKGVTAKVWGRGSLIPWRAIARYEINPTGVLLSPYPESTALAGFRGLFVPFSTRRAELLAALEYYLGTAGK